MHDKLREQLNRALKLGGVRMLNFSRTVNAYTVRIFILNAFSICLDGHFN